MPINSVHPAYTENKEMWQDCRDCFNGGRAVKGMAERYLPKLGGQNQSEYDSYKERALFFPIVSKTVSAMVGLATYKNPTVVYPPQMKAYFEDNQGAQFKELFVGTMEQTVLIGRIGILVDAPEVGGDPYVATYHSENILNWRFGDDGELSWVVLQEYIVQQKSTADEYELTSVAQYRKLMLADGVYRVEIYNDKKEFVRAIVPTFSGQTLDFIPFLCVGTTGVHLDVDKSPMDDIAQINISHYRTSADLEWGRHFTGLPTPVVSGVDASSSLRIGGMSAWILPDPGAKAMYLEFTGQGLQSLEKALGEKQGQMASMSARMIDQGTRGSEAAETVRLRYLSETASLTQIVESVEKALNHVFHIIAQMLRVTGEIKIELSRDFLAAKLTAQDLTALFNAYFQGGISKESLVYNLRRGELLDPKRTDDEELSAIQDPQTLDEKLALAKAAAKPATNPGSKSTSKGAA